MIEIHNLQKRLSKSFCIDIENLIIPDGITAFIGPNGSGKSTLIRLIAGILKPDKGEIITKSRIGCLPQSSYPFRGSADDNLKLVCKDKKRRAELLELCGLSEKKNADCRTFSGGEKQRMFIARILAGDFDSLLLDEPTNALDVESSDIIRNALISHSKDKNISIVMSTHSPAEAKNMADYIVMLNDGQVAEHGTPSEILQSPTSAWGKKFLSQWVL